MKIDAVKSDKIPPSKMPAAVTATPPAAAAGIGPSTTASVGGASPVGTTTASTTAASVTPPALPIATASTSNGSTASTNGGGGGDDLGPSDEVKVFNNEGEDEREEAAERVQEELLQEKTSLITESEKVRNSYFHVYLRELSVVRCE